LALHSGPLAPEERAVRDGIPLTSLPRTLLDLADTLDPARWNRAAAEAERLGLLQLQSLEDVCDRAAGRPACAFAET
jgi:hypothetical protein